MKAITIGTFDGVHLGHQKIFQVLSDFGCPTQAITFANHPLDILHPANAPLPLTPPFLKQALFSAYGIEETTILPFTRELASLSYKDFLAPYEIAHLVVGEDAAIGQGRLGTPDALRFLGLQRGFQVHVVPKLQCNGEAISSTKIRQAVSEGNLSYAEKLLGRPYCFAISSAKAHSLLPPDGRYFVYAHSPGGIIPTTLTIENRVPELALEQPQLISFGPLNPTLTQRLCHPTSPAEL